jgi:nitroimidazol reductase NimA-like FMN-containing flavoprotein (pyridoxamine 5'-phosphate oxidase superfamily)
MSSRSLLSPRTKVKRLPRRGDYDRETIENILDDSFLCHVGFVNENQPFVIPTSYGRVGENIYIHGSAASRMLRGLAGGIEVCLTVTILDGIVLARSAFNHSMNYRSVVILGNAELVTDPDEKIAALEVISEQIIPGRWADARPPTAKELKATNVLRLPIEEASAKIRTGPPVDDEDDYSLPFWAGVLPIELVRGPAIADPKLDGSIKIPDYL